MRQKWRKMEISVVFGSAEGHFWPKFKKILFFIKYGYKLNYIGGHPNDWAIWLIIPHLYIDSHAKFASQCAKM